MDLTSITLENFPEFKKAYTEAIDEGKDKFDFKGDEVLVGYAKYVIEYVESV